MDTNPFTTAKQKSRPLILDGAMGSLLQQKGFISSGLSWMTDVNEKSPETILSVHKEYIEAGANIITTNTFRTNPVALRDRKNTNSKNLVKGAVKLAINAKDNKSVFIAGSNAPAEDCYQKERTISQKELELNHINHIDLLIDNGVDFILNETQSHFDEIKVICSHCFNYKIPYVLSLYIDSNIKLISREDIEQVLDFIWEHDPLAVGINCITPELFENSIKHFNTEYEWGFYINCGAGLPADHNITCGISPDKYAELVKNNLNLSPSFIGSCCGSSPKHTKEIKKVIDG
ncbi:MAG: homocysteine S-methyltransferase family protein [Ignavibacterium sp.]|nr:MAG: homocysteine S-methyltransferase family protein [Ignavibacterium sp.]